jgi:NDP-sugar pyrophosphorylase family protein
VHGSAVLVLSEQPASAICCDLADADRIEPQRVPVNCLEILGRSAVAHTIDRLRQAGIEAISVIAAAQSLPALTARGLEVTIAERPAQRWSIAAQALQDQAAQGAADVIVMELGAYVECDFAEALQFHRAKRNLLTQLQEKGQPLDLWIVNGAAARLLAHDCIFPLGAGRALGRPVPFAIKGYVNQLASARDIRRLVMDVFLARCAIRPQGREVRPGVWMDEGARAHRSARILAPAYLGRSARLGPSAVLARFSNVERNCQVGAGTLVASSSVLAHTAVGKGLDVSGAVVRGNELVDLRYNLAIRIDDATLIRDTAPRPLLVPQHQPEAVTPAEGTADGFEPEYLPYGSRAAVSFSEVFKGEI